MRKCMWKWLAWHLAQKRVTCSINSIRSSGCNSRKSDCKGHKSITGVTLAYPDHSIDGWVLSWRRHRKRAVRVGRANDRVAIAHQDGNLQVWLGKKRTQPIRYWLLDLEHPVLRAGLRSTFLVSPDPKWSQMCQASACTPACGSLGRQIT